MNAIIGAVGPFVFKSCLGFTKNCDEETLHLHLGKILKGLGRTNGGDQVSCGSSNAKEASIRPRRPLHGWNRPSATRRQPETETLEAP